MPDSSAPEKRFDDESGKDGLGQSLGILRTLYMDAEKGRAAIEVEAEMRMCHSGGVVQGGFVTGWIDAAMARAAMCVTNFEQTKRGSSGVAAPPCSLRAISVMQRATLSRRAHPPSACCRSST
jgi:acyl-coenzyme A thioesterase PaaI-like protein